MTSAEIIKRLNEKVEELGLDIIIEPSKAKHKRFRAIRLSNKKVINFGDPNGTTYFDVKDEQKKKNYRARHSKIMNKHGEYVYKIPYSASYLSWHLLWS